MNVSIKYSKVNVINRYQVNNIVSTIYDNNPEDALTTEQVNEIYDTLYPYTQVDDITKQNHIDNINVKIKENNIDVIPVSIEGDVSQEEEVNHIVEPVEKNSTLEEQDEQNNDLDNNTLNNENVDNPSENEKLICPECGAELLLRTARYGEHAGENFYGCSNYPKCKYIQKK